MALIRMIVWHFAGSFTWNHGWTKIVTPRKKDPKVYNRESIQTLNIHRHFLRAKTRVRGECTLDSQILPQGLAVTE